MAYVIWRVFMKKYSKVRLGLTNRITDVTPSERGGPEPRTRELEVSFAAEGAWTPGEEYSLKYTQPETSSELQRNGSSKCLSKSKRVKSFIQKKCKDVATTLSGSNVSGEPAVVVSSVCDTTSTSWYVTSDYHSDEEAPNHVTVIPVETKVFDTSDTVTVSVQDEPLVIICNDIVDSRNRSDEEVNIRNDGVVELPRVDNKSAELHNITGEIPAEVSKQEVYEETADPDLNVKEVKLDLGTLVDQYFGGVYSNYEATRHVLMRQARDLLVCTYHGNLYKFRDDFCKPAAALLEDVSQRANIEVVCGVSPRGWPLSLGSRGVVLHLGELDTAVLRTRDCYLCVRVGSEGKPEVALVWSAGSRSCRYSPSALTMMTATEELPELLQDLVVSVERAIERVPLDELPFPCPQCHECLTEVDCVSHCRCGSTEKKDSSIQTSPIFELDASIPHIDSDEEPEEGDTKRFPEPENLIVQPKSISEISENLLMSGIYLPGIHDNRGRAVVLYDAACVTRAALSYVDIARVILYYATIPGSSDRVTAGLTVLALNVRTEASLHQLDKSLALVMTRQKISSVLLWKSSLEPDKISRTSRTLSISKLKCYHVNDTENLRSHIQEDQIPSECGGNTTHDQLEWVEFYKEFEPLTTSCQSCGRRLVGIMSDVRNSGGESLNRKQVNHQHRAMTRVLNDSEMQRLRRDGHKTLAQLEERAQWLPDSEDVRLCVERAERLFCEVDKAAKRLELLSDTRKDRLRDFARLKSLEEETNQVLTWLSHKGEDSLKRHSHLASTLPALKLQEQDFEKFYFISMRHLDKGGDLLEEAGQVTSNSGSGLKDLARSLKQHLRGFSERLEDTRERLEDTSRCFYLLDKAYEWALEAMKYMSRVKPEETQNPDHSVKQLRQYLMAHPPLASEHFTEMMNLAKKLRNDKLLEQCKVAQCRCEETMEQVQEVLGGEPSSWRTSTPLPGRRRSLPSPQHTPGHNCPCWDPGDYTSTPTSHLDDIREECFCKPPNPLQRSCTWQYPTELYDYEDKQSSSADNTTEGSDGGTKSEDIEENPDSSSKAVSPIPVNSHLHCDLSLELDPTSGGVQTLKTKKTMLLIMREMIQTERDYVKSLEYVIENYIPELVRDDIPQALRGQRNVVFGNIEKIYEFHVQFFLQELEKCEHNPISVGQCFLRHESRFYLYALYNKNKPKSDSLMSEYGTTFFKTKQLELGDKMDLASYLLKPVQRMGKYALLLQQLMKASRQEVVDLREAETMVRFQLRHGNDLLAMDSLRDCDVNVKEQGRLLRQNEFLVWQGKSKKCLRQVFLFEELILFSKAQRFPDRKNLDIFIYKNSIKMSDIGLTAEIGDSTTKFEIWFRKRKPNDTFTLQSMSEDIKQAWTNELSNLLWKQARRNRELRLMEMCSMGIGNKPCLDIRPSVDQISDRSISIAQLSKTAPRFRNSIAVMPMETVRKRPHSIVSMSSSSGASSSSSGENVIHSQCSSAESGIVSDWNATNSIASDSTSPNWHEQITQTQ